MKRASQKSFTARTLDRGESEGFSLSGGMISSILEFAKPFGHHEEKERLNLGFGFLYYGFVRALRPNHVLVIGSGYGFSVVCLALGLKDNGKGHLTFVDPSYSVLKDGPFKTVGGRGYWKNAESVTQHFSRFGVETLITHHKLTNKEFFPGYESLGLPAVDLAFLDGNHSFENVRYDFLQTLARSKKNTYIFLHDSSIYLREIIGNSGVKKWLSIIKKEKELLQMIDLPFASGVAIVRVMQGDAWKCLQTSCSEQ